MAEKKTRGSEELIEYVDALGYGEKANFAARIGVPGSYLSRYLSASMRPNIASAYAIEAATYGLIPPPKWLTDEEMVALATARAKALEVMPTRGHPDAQARSLASFRRAVFDLRQAADVLVATGYPEGESLRGLVVLMEQRIKP